MEFQRGRYSWVLRPVLIILDILIINILAYVLLPLNNQGLYFFSFDILNNKNLLYVIYSSLLWLISSYVSKFYYVYRYTSSTHILVLIIKQFFLFSIIVYAFIGVFRSINIEAFDILKYLLTSFIIIGLIKLLSYYILKTVRVYLNGNLRNIIVVGNGAMVKELENIFKNKKELGYKIKGVFNKAQDTTSGSIWDSFKLLESDNNIDEIYCAIDELSEKEINTFIKYATLNHCNIKFVPNTQKLFSKRLKTDFYNYVPVLSLEDVSLNQDINQFIKRSFDVMFSLLVIIFILSWLSIILYVLIKIETRGPFLYRHKRTGINYKEFYCYKFRSLKTTEEIKGTYVTENDKRVTKIGKILRTTSIDELPQFINVLKGEMSVVGPRPHMLSYTEDYSKVVNKYNFIFRHKVKPGITGLAQIKGYRGEIKSNSDIINRVKYDIFYIENWSLLLDIKIIIQTLINSIKGEEKAY